MVALVEPISLPNCSIVSSLEVRSSFNLDANDGKKKKKNIKSPLDKCILPEYNKIKKYSNGIHNWKGDNYDPAKTNPFGK